MKTAVRATSLARLLIAGVLALLALPAVASAGAAHLEPRAGGLEELVYDARSGEVNQLLLSYDSYTRIWRVDDAAGVSPGRSCALDDATHAVCTVSGGARASGLANVDLGDRDDGAAVLGPGLTRAVLAGGTGNDILIGGPEADAFWQGDRSDGSDRMVGGSGNDTVDYAGRRRPVRARVGGRGGQRGERDAIAADVETLVGGRAGDTLV